MKASLALLLMALAAAAAAAPAAAPRGYVSSAQAAKPGSKTDAVEGAGWDCPMDMAVVLPAINYTSNELPCLMEPGTTAAQADNRTHACLDLKGKVALITGASTGIGRGTADRLAKAGMTVVGTSRAPQNYTDDCSGQGNTYENPGDTCRPVGWELWQLDQTNQTSVDELIAKVNQTYGHIDFLFLNAGRGYGTPIFNGMYEKCGLFQTMQDNFDVNFWGPLRVWEAALPLLSPDAFVLLTSSVNSVVLVPGSIAYTADKRGVNALADEWMAEKLNATGIRVSTLYPGNVKTDVIRDSNLGGDGCSGNLSVLVSIEQASYFTPGVGVMNASEAGESVFRMVIDPQPPLRILMAPLGDVPFQWKRMCRRMAAPMELWVPPGWASALSNTTTMPND